jgi:hypothetical protein
MVSFHTDLFPFLTFFQQSWLNHPNYDCWARAVYDQVEDFKRILVSGRTSVPEALCRQGEWLLQGPNHLTQAEVDDILDDLVTWGVSELHIFEQDGPGPAQSVQVYSGLAGIIHRHEGQGVPVPFYVHSTVINIMYGLGMKLYDEDDGNVYDMFFAKQAKTALRRKKLESAIRMEGGHLSSAENPVDMDLVHVQQKMWKETLESRPDPTEMKSLVPEHDFESSKWSENKWVDGYIHEVDLEPGQCNPTLQEFIPVVGKDVAILAVQYQKRTNPLMTQGSRNGPCIAHSGTIVPSLNPSLPHHVVEFPFREYSTYALMQEGQGPDAYFCHNGSWFGLMDGNGFPSGKGIAIFVLGPLQSTEGYEFHIGMHRGEEHDQMEFYGSMAEGYPEGLGDLTFQGRTLYSGRWHQGVCVTAGDHLRGCCGMSPREVYRFYLRAKDWMIRYNPLSNHETLELVHLMRDTTGTVKKIVHDISNIQTVQKMTQQYRISSHVMRYIRRPDVKRLQAWSDFTTGCSTQDYIKLVPVTDEGSGNVYVTSCVGPRESYFNDDDYEYVVFANYNNNYSMFQRLLTPLNCVGLEFCGAYKGGKADVSPQYLGVFRCNDVRYEHVEENRWPITKEFVHDFFGRYLDVLHKFPNHLVNLKEMGAKDRGFIPKNPKSDGWLMYPRENRLQLACPKFYFWADRPKDLVSIVQGCVLNLFEVLYVPGGRWRFFGRFNHDLEKIVQRWYQLDEAWMNKYLKPQCMEDLFTKAVPFTKIDVYKTGKAACTH